ncbi:MAG: SCP2 sterol-binding domain-containing protein [Lachnospiraceae bacterium]|nr:SCP2 sterol-binding domain-containing protein [Lachnospiraceae bacterium]
MTYEDIVREAKQAAERIDTSVIDQHAAIEIDVEGEGEGAFYVELDNGWADVQPYEYYDYDCKIRTNADTLTVLLSGMLDAASALSDGKINVEGNIEKAIVFATALRTLND